MLLLAAQTLLCFGPSPFRYSRMRTEKPRGKQRPPGRQSSYFITKRQIKESFYLHGLCCLLLAWAFAFCLLPRLGTFTFQDSHPLPCPGCFWLSSLGSCCFHLSCFTSAPVPFHRPRLLAAPPWEFLPVNKQGFPTLPREASSPAPIARAQRGHSKPLVSQSCRITARAELGACPKGQD